jgi:pyruvate dehydrogenase E2 component (dihydrolipoamide acetyltransferase)
MPIELKMPALSPTMEEGTLAKWLVKEGDEIVSGDIMAEIETDKATMEFEAVDEGVLAKILVPEGTDDVKVGAVIAIIAEEGEEPKPEVDTSSGAKEATVGDSPSANLSPKIGPSARKLANTLGVDPVTVEATGPKDSITKADVNNASRNVIEDPSQPSSAPIVLYSDSERIAASPLARRLAEQNGLDLASLSGSGPKGRIVKADIDAALAGDGAAVPAKAEAASASVDPGDIPHNTEKLSNMRKTIARRLTEAKQTVPHIYLTVDIRLDALLALRSELNASLEPRNIKLSVNDLLVKALAAALMQVPKCNVSFAGDQLISYNRADISVAVSIPNGLITPIITGANEKSLSTISAEVSELAGRAKEGKLQPHEYQGGTASISNMGMFGIKQFDAVINPPQGMIMAIGAGEKRPYVIDDSLQIATVMSATGSFDHRAIDGADGAQLMQAFKQLVENPLGMLA